MWTYATMGMSTEEEISGTELHMFAQSRNDSIVELLNAVAHFHRTGASLNLGDTVNFGRPWWSGSQSDHALVSLPYLDGPLLEWLPIENRRIRFLWLLPITKEELAFKKSAGVEELERQFEKEQVNYLDPNRESVV